MKVQILFLFVLSLNMVYAQDNFQVASFSLTIKGSSNLHDWQSNAKELRATGAFAVEAGELQAINALSVEVPVKSIKSEKGSIMDNKTYKALDANKHPAIKYKLDKATVNKKGDKYDVNASGSLTIAGVTNKVSFYVAGKTGSDGSLTFNGSYKLKMTDYKIDPPTALLGTMTVGDDVEVVFRVTLKSK